VTVTGDPESRR